MQDAFTRYFDSDVFRDFLLLFQRLGVKVFVLPYFPNGKPLQIHGFNKRFERLKDKNRHSLIEAALSGIPLVGLDPAMTMVFRQEYRKNSSFNLPILLPQEWLNGYLTVKGKDIYIRKKITKKKYFLAAHCTEKTQIPSAGKDWQKVFEFFGLKLQNAYLNCHGGIKLTILKLNCSRLAIPAVVKLKVVRIRKFCIPCRSCWRVLASRKLARMPRFLTLEIKSFATLFSVFSI